MGGVLGELGSGRLEVDTGGKDVVEVVEPDDVGRGVGGEEAGGEAGLSETPVPDEGLWLVEDTSSSVLVAARGGPFWFPSGPGGPFLFPSRPGAFRFTGSRMVRGSGKGGGLVGL